MDYFALEDIEIAYKNDARHSEANLTDFMNLHKTQIDRIETLSIRVRFDIKRKKSETNEIRAKKNNLIQAGEIEKANSLNFLPAVECGDMVQFNFSSLSFRTAALSISIQGRDEVKVDGLTKKLVDTLNRSRSGIPLFRGNNGYEPAFLGFLSGFFATNGILVLKQKLSNPHSLITFSIFLPFVTGALTSLFCFHLWRSMPPLEILENGEKSRFTGFRKNFLTLILGIIGSIIVLLFLPHH